jgi:hypothetical protein
MEIEMKRTALPILLLVGSLLLAAPALAQPATPEATPDALTPQQVLALAQKAQADAANANNNAINVVNTANNAVNTVNLLLNLVQAASLFGTVLAGAFALLGARWPTTAPNWIKPTPSCRNGAPVWTPKPRRCASRRTRPSARWR